jgi:hypothetical protein
VATSPSPTAWWTLRVPGSAATWCRRPSSGTAGASRANVTFLVLDALVDPLPPGDVVVVRHVLQHLTNDQVAIILAKLCRYRRWIITELVPAGAFEPNHDKPMDGHTRLSIDSGVVPTAAPFGIVPKEARILCEITAEGGVIRTIAYDFDPAKH